jgi:hypothetical protein
MHIEMVFLLFLEKGRDAELKVAESVHLPTSILFVALTSWKHVFWCNLESGLIFSKLSS